MKGVFKIYIINFENRFNDAEEWQRQRYAKLVSNFDGIDLSDEEKRYLLWLAGSDGDTERTFSGLFKKLKNEK